MYSRWVLAIRNNSLSLFPLLLPPCSGRKWCYSGHRGRGGEGEGGGKKRKWEREECITRRERGRGEGKRLNGSLGRGERGDRAGDTGKEKKVFLFSCPTIPAILPFFPRASYSHPPPTLVVVAKSGQRREEGQRRRKEGQSEYWSNDFSFPSPPPSSHIHIHAREGGCPQSPTFPSLRYAGFRRLCRL